MSVPLRDHLDEIGARVAAAQRVLLFLDYDGTLTPIVRRPSLAQLARSTRGLLEALSRESRVVLAIVSGRAVADLQVRVGVENVIYAGNHGLEIHGRGLHFVEPFAAERRAELLQLSSRLSRHLGPIPGVEIEYKGLTMTIHFRRAPEEEVVRISGLVCEAVQGSASRFVWSAGKKCLEVRPRVDWNKGAAACWIRSKLGPAGALSIYLGDDTTDEDAFLAFPEDITVKVGDPAGSAARYHVTGPGQVIQFLRWVRNKEVS
jgi:trehalose-phosphatase